MTENHNDSPAQVKAKAPEDGAFPELKKLTYKEMYDLVAKFLRKAIPIKGEELSIISCLQNRTSTPKAPYITLQIIDDKKLSTTETRYTDKHKILWSRSQISIKMTFIGGGNIAALEMAKAFTIRFNDSWATEQFEQYSDILFPLYSDDIEINNFSINEENQYEDSCSVVTYFEYHPEFGVCEASTKEIEMSINIAKWRKGIL